MNMKSLTNQCYLKNKELSVVTLGRGMTWFDCGSQSSLIEASQAYIP